MNGFKTWLEQEEDWKPYLDYEWDGRRLTVRWREPSVQASVFNQKHYFYKPDQFGYVELEPLEEMPGYMYAGNAGIEDVYQKSGYGTEMYQAALKKVKELGFKGIISDRTTRSKLADKLWRKLSTKQQGNWDFLEGCAL